MTIEMRMFCDYESCTSSVPLTEVMPKGWVYTRMRRVAFGGMRELHFCSLDHVSMHQLAIAKDERESEDVDV